MFLIFFCGGALRPRLVQCGRNRMFPPCARDGKFYSVVTMKSMPLVIITHAAHTAAAKAVVMPSTMRSRRALLARCAICHAKATCPSRTLRLSIYESSAAASCKRSSAVYIFRPLKVVSLISPPEAIPPAGLLPLQLGVKTHSSRSEKRQEKS